MQRGIRRFMPSRASSSSQSLPLFYSGVEALDRDRHRALRLDRLERPFAFASQAHVLPALLGEFPNACRDMTILFVEEQQTVSPLFLVGHRAGISSFVDASGNWTGRHVPAYLRRYPFIGATSSENEQAICFDPGCAALQSEHGELLFAEDGAPTATLERVMGFVGEYFAAGQVTRDFMQALQTHGLLRAIDVRITSALGHHSAYHGFLAVDEPALASLGEAEFTSLRRKGYLTGIYAHLISLANLNDLGRRADDAEQVAESRIETTVSS